MQETISKRLPHCGTRFEIALEGVPSHIISRNVGDDPLRKSYPKMRQMIACEDRRVCIFRRALGPNLHVRQRVPPTVALGRGAGIASSRRAGEAVAIGPTSRRRVPLPPRRPPRTKSLGSIVCLSSWSRPCVRIAMSRSTMPRRLMTLMHMVRSSVGTECPDDAVEASYSDRVLHGEGTWPLSRRGRETGPVRVEAAALGRYFNMATLAVGY